MAWKQQRTSQSVTVDADVNVSVDEFTEEQLLQGLIDADWLSKEEAEAIQKRAASKEKASIIGVSWDAEEIAEARSCMLRGQRGEALVHIERFLGRDWSGRLA